MLRSPQKLPIHRRAFTLIELMVVVAIMIIIISVAIPAIKSMTKGNDAVQAQNMLSALIANTRSMAIGQGRSAALILYEQNTGSAAQTSAVFAVEDLNPPAPVQGDLYLIPTGTGLVQQLPVGAKVAGLGETGSVGSLSVASGKPRIILFDNQGQMSVRGPNASNIGGIRLSSSSADSAINATLTQWNSEFGSGQPWTTTPGFVVYSQSELAAAAPSDVNKWLLQNAKVLVVNAYTGTVIR